MYSFNIVIARYNEDVEWTKQFPNVIIYNKGISIGNGYNEVLLKNVGREGHSYYKYICDNYDNLSDYTIFLQGMPFDHSPNLISNIYNCINNKDLNITFKYFSEGILYCNLSGCQNHTDLPLIDVYEKLFNERKNELFFIYGMGAQFIVYKKNILNRPKEFYNKIVELLQYDINPIEGFVIERFHPLIFDIDFDIHYNK